MTGLLLASGFIMLPAHRTLIVVVLGLLLIIGIIVCTIIRAWELASYGPDTDNHLDGFLAVVRKIPRAFAVVFGTVILAAIGAVALGWFASWMMKISGVV